MCGIAGIIRVTPAGQPPRGIDDAWILALDQAIAWRGPDDRGVFRDTARAGDGQTVEVALVHRRLSIIDHAGGHQPMSCSVADGAARAHEHEASGPAGRGEAGGAAGGRMALVFNGAIYNHRALRATLIAAGAMFASDHSDTEALLRLCQHLGDHTGWPGALARGGDEAAGLGDGSAEGAGVQGMYALACWDGRRAQLLLARDASGEKPLWVTRRAGGLLAFASTAAALAQLHALLGWEGALSWVEDAVVAAPKGGAAALQPAACADWLALGWSSMHAPQRGIAAIRPGAACVVDARAIDALTLAQLGWDPPGPARPARTTTARARARQLRTTPRQALALVDQQISAAVQQTLDADVPIGLFLSGGVDSSLVAHYACQHAGPLPAYCVRMPDPAYDESAYAQQAASACGAKLTLIDPPADPLADLRALIGLIGVPLGDSSLLPAWWLCRGAGQSVRVALTGDGGDELFLGYERQRAARWLGALAPLAWALPPAVVGRVLDRRDPKSRSAKLARLIDAARGVRAPGGGMDLLAIFPRSLRQRVLAGPVDGQLLGHRYDARFDLEHALPGDLMLKTDTASMAAHVEARAPLLHPLVRKASASLPRSTLALGGKRKGLLRALARRHYPAALVDRPKMGFAVPIGRWLAEDHGGLGTALGDALASSQPFGPLHDALPLSMPALRSMFDEHRAGRVDHGQRLFVLLSLWLWVGQGAEPGRAMVSQAALTRSAE
jgi:asparagine synthase (glutamine-hydrolysing)